VPGEPGVIGQGRVHRCYEADEGPPQSSALSFVPS
jgi:hypothetical protein